jgi:hypothetical protein
MPVDTGTARICPEQDIAALGPQPERVEAPDIGF